MWENCIKINLNKALYWQRSHKEKIKFKILETRFKETFINEITF